MCDVRAQLPRAQPGLSHPHFSAVTPSTRCVHSTQWVGSAHTVLQEAARMLPTPPPFPASHEGRSLLSLLKETRVLQTESVWDFLEITFLSTTHIFHDTPGSSLIIHGDCVPASC